jgi:hypothetical protein
MDDYSLVGCLTSSTTSKRRIGVQSVVVRTAFLHIRFTMHRPYASLAHGEASKYTTSLEISVNAADKLIALSAHARPEMLDHGALAVAGHMTWGPVHCFSAAMFFCFQIINNPEQPGARLCRANILRAIATLESCRDIRVAERALDILCALDPLYAEEFLSDTPEAREQKKQDVLPAVRRLQFPYVDSSNIPIGSVEVCRSGDGALSPAQSSTHAESPRPGPGPPAPDAPQPPHPNAQGTGVHAQEPEMLTIPPAVPPPTPMLQPHQQHLLHHQHQQQQAPTCEDAPPLKWSHPELSFSEAAQYVGQQQGHPALAQQHQQQQYGDGLPGQPEEGEAMWQSAHHTPTVTMVPAESPAASSPRALYASQMIPQDAYPHAGGGTGGGALNGRMGPGAGAGSVLWGATSGFVQGEWDRMYTGLGGRMPHEG